MLTDGWTDRRTERVSPIWLMPIKRGPINQNNSRFYYLQVVPNQLVLQTLWHSQIEVQLLNELQRLKDHVSK